MTTEPGPSPAVTPAGNPISPEESAAALAKVLEGAGPKTSGKFLSFDGSELPW